MNLIALKGGTDWYEEVLVECGQGGRMFAPPYPSTHPQGLVYKRQQRMTEADAALRKAVQLALTAPVVRFAELPLLV